MSGSTGEERLRLLLKPLKLPSFASDHAEVARLATEEGWSYTRYLMELCEREIVDRGQRRIERLLRQSGLPLEKTPETLDASKLTAKVRKQLGTLYEGAFVDRAENVLAFGLPGRGKTHALCALGHELVRQGYSVLFLPAYKLVQRLLLAKRELELERAISPPRHDVRAVQGREATATPSRSWEWKNREVVGGRRENGSRRPYRQVESESHGLPWTGRPPGRRAHRAALESCGKPTPRRAEGDVGGAGSRTPRAGPALSLAWEGGGPGAATAGPGRVGDRLGGARE